MRKLLLAVLPVLVCVTAHAQFLFRISGGALERPSYMLGTVHNLPGDILDTIPAYQEAEAQCRQMYVEHDVPSMVRQAWSRPAGTRKAATLPEGTTIFDLLDSDSGAMLKAKFKETLNIDLTAPAWKSLWSWPPSLFLDMLVSRLSSDVRKQLPQFRQGGMDLTLMAKARERGWKVGTLDAPDMTVDTLLAAGTPPASIESQADSLMAFLKNYEARKQDMTADYLKTVGTWMSGDFKGFVAFVAAKDLLENADVYKDRNRKWLPRMEAAMREAPTMFAFGSGHLAGPDGIVSLLRKAGYEVEQITVWQKCNDRLPVARRVLPVRCSDDNHQEGVANEGDIALTVDGRRATIWHSAYAPVHRKVTPETPAELVYEFDGAEQIDRMVYVPRQMGSNGNITQAEVYVKTAHDSGERLVGRFDWLPDAEEKTVAFDGGLRQPQRVRVRVLSGAGGFASCAEMLFLNDENTAIASPLFADELLTTLKDGVTDEDIRREPIAVLRELARQLKRGTYDTAYRVAAYDCYDSPDYLSRQWHTPGKHYDILQGVTGVMVEPGKHLVVVSGLEGNRKAQLKVVAWYTGKSGKNFDGGDPDIQTFTLGNGANVIDYVSPWAGLAYIAYFSDGQASGTAPIRVHFVGGTVNGYLSPDMTNAEMHQMTMAAPSRFMDLAGRKVHAVWTAQGLHEYCKADDGTSPGYRQYMNVLDTLMAWEQRLVGFEKYGRIPPNRTLLYVNYTYGALFQSALGISSHADNEPTLLNCRKLISDDTETIWGLSHEWGHQHQLAPFFCWGGMAEVTNNINSYYNVMHMGYRYDQLHPGKRKGLEQAVSHYIDGNATDCILQSADYFERLSPFLMLHKYFAGKGRKPDFIPDLYERLRTSGMSTETDKKKHRRGQEADDTNADRPADTSEVVPYVMNFIRQASLVSGYDLTPFFERFGFLRVTEFEIDDYGKFHYRLTQTQLDDFHEDMRSLAKKHKLKAMTESMVEDIARSPDIEYPRPHFDN